jgi:hypothetical protein
MIIEIVDFENEEATFQQFSKAALPQEHSQCHTVVIKEGRGRKMETKELAFKTALLFKFLPNVKKVKIYGDSDYDILCYVLVLSQTNEKYGRKFYALSQSNFN